MGNDNNLICPKCETIYDSDVNYCINDGVKLIEKKEFLPRCVICNKSYTENIKFCPDDGGKVKIIATKKKTSPTFKKIKWKINNHQKFTFFYSIWFVMHTIFILSSRCVWGGMSSVKTKYFFPFTGYPSFFYQSEKNPWELLVYIYDFLEYSIYIISPLILYFIFIKSGLGKYFNLNFQTDNLSTKNEPIHLNGDKNDLVFLKEVSIILKCKEGDLKIILTNSQMSVNDEVLLNNEKAQDGIYHFWRNGWYKKITIKNGRIVKLPSDYSLVIWGFIVPMIIFILLFVFSNL